jgi:hypothetical protein
LVLPFLWAHFLLSEASVVFEVMPWQGSHHCWLVSTVSEVQAVWRAWQAE